MNLLSTLGLRLVVKPAIFLLSIYAYLCDAEAPSIETVEVVGQRLNGGMGLAETQSASNRLALNPLEIPASVELISREEIAIRGDISAQSAITRATGFSSSASPGNGGTATSVRGFNGHNSVVYTYDGTRLYVGAGTVTFPADTWTIERVEVLRGPGSVINGVGAIGATVNYIPRTPTPGESRGELDLTLGSHNLRRIAGGIEGSAGQTVGYRLDAVYHRREGYVANAEEQRQAIAGTLLARPEENLELRIGLDFANTEQAPYWGTPLVDGKIVAATRDNNYNVADGIIKYKDWWPRLSLNWRINDTVTFRNDTYYLTSDRHWRNVENYDYNPATGDVDRSFYLEILHDQVQTGNRGDFLFAFNAGGAPVKLSLGAEANAIEFTHTNNRPYNSVADDSVDLLNPVPGLWRNGVQSRTSKDFTSDSFQTAVFTDLQLKLTPKFSFVTGLRHDRFDVDRTDFARRNDVSHQEDAGETHIGFSGTSWRLGAVLQPTPATSLYAQISQAHDPVQSILSATDPTLELGEGRQVEAGVKQSLWNDRVQYTLALFDITKENLVSRNPGGEEVQIGQQSSSGIEFDVFAQVSNSVSLDFNVALTEPEFDEFVTGGGDFAGNRPRNVPKRTANAWIYWQPAQRWLASAGLRHVGERFVDNANTTLLPAYNVVDANLQWMVNDAIRLNLRGRNLTDEADYILSPYGSQWVLAEGRAFVMAVNVRF